LSKYPVPSPRRKLSDIFSSSFRYFFTSLPRTPLASR